MTLPDDSTMKQRIIESMTVYYAPDSRSAGRRFASCSVRDTATQTFFSRVDMNIEIKHRFTGAVLFSTEVADTDPNPIRTAVVRAVLTGADLTGADLTGANLNGADLTGADLNGADLARANLTGAYLTGANLTGAYLTGADLAGANLTGANLTGANLNGADLANIRADVRDVLDRAPNEVIGLLAAIRAGKIDGSSYDRECACLVGTIAKVRGEQYDCLVGIVPDSDRPAERWFLAIGPGYTPDNSQVSAITDDWICEWQAERGEGDFYRGDLSRKASH